MNYTSVTEPERDYALPKCVECGTCVEVRVSNSEKNPGKEYYMCSNKECDQKFNGFVGAKPFKKWDRKGQKPRRVADGSQKLEKTVETGLSDIRAKLKKTRKGLSADIAAMEESLSQQVETAVRRLLFACGCMPGRAAGEAGTAADTPPSTPVLRRQQACMVEREPPGAPTKKRAASSSEEDDIDIVVPTVKRSKFKPVAPAPK